MILRNLNIASGNLNWHLDVLESYHIIRKERLGNYITYYPYYLENPLSQVDLLIQKSEKTVKILHFIQNHPGFNQTDLAKILKFDRGTLRYHLSKLQEAHLIHTIKKGRYNCYYLE